jgi:peptidoglycan glycosyltransferase
MNAQIRVVAAVFIFLFVLLTANTSYIILFQGKDLATAQGNTRALEAELNTRRGAIQTADGVILADSKDTPKGYERTYPQGSLASHIIGYSSHRYNKSGLEKEYNSYLLGIESATFVEDLIRKFKRPDKQGGSLTLTLESSLQKIAETQLAGKKGAVVAIDPATGAVLAMASSPSYDPNTIDKEWAAISADQDAPLVNRATESAYPPGSTFKIITSAAALEERLYKPEDTFDGVGELDVMGTTVRNLDGKDWGTVTFKEALEYSVNTVFATIGLKLGADQLFQYASRFGFNESLDFDLPVKISRVKRANAMDDVDVAWTAIGQAKTVATPLEMALATAAIANDGIMMRPYIVREIKDARGQVILTGDPAQENQVIKAETANTLTDMMVGVTEEGFGGVVNMPGVRVASKTGTAETGVAGETHGWFVAFAPADNPQIAIAVIVEKGGTGGGSAGPIVRALLEEALKTK